MMLTKKFTKRKMCIMGNSEVHRDFLESFTFISALLFESSENTVISFVKE